VVASIASNSAIDFLFTCRAVEIWRFLDLLPKRLSFLGQSRYPCQVYFVSTIGTYLLSEIDFSIEFFLQLGMNFDLVRSESVVLHVFPFNSEKKRGGVAVKRVIDLSQCFMFLA
jgi:hypothetical protein